MTVEGADSPRNRTLGLIEQVAAGDAPVGILQAHLLSDLSHRFAQHHLVSLSELTIQLSDPTDTGETDPFGRNITVSDKALRSLREVVDGDENIYRALLDISELEESRLRIARTVRSWAAVNIQAGQTITQDNLIDVVQVVCRDNFWDISRISSGWESRERFPDRPWAKIIEGEPENGIPEVYILGWRSGDQTPIHDHDQAEVGVYILEGAVEEEMFVIPGKEILQEVIEGRGRFQTKVVTTVLPEGSVVKLGAPYIHVFRGSGVSTRGIAISVHAYTDLDTMHFFNHEQGDDEDYLAFTETWDQEKYQNNQVDIPKVRLLDKVISEVARRVGRSVTDYEAKALGFLVDRNWQNDVGNFLRRVCGVFDEDEPYKVSWQIHQRVYDEVISEADKRLGEVSDFEEGARLSAIKTFANAQHKSEMENSEILGVYMGGVPYSFLPAWVAGYYLKS